MSAERQGAAARARTARKPAADALEGRCLLTAAPGLSPDVVMLDASTADSRGVTVDYRVDGAPLTAPLAFAVARSAADRLDASSMPVATVTLGAGQADDAGLPATAVGTHRVTLDLPEGLPTTPALPYVVVQADPTHTAAQPDAAHDEAAFRKGSLAVIAHGGVQTTTWKDGGPPWERRLAETLKAQGYDRVIAYNWVSESNTPGTAALQGPKLAAEVRGVVNAFPAGEPVDVHFIGHSEGAVVNSQALLQLNTSGWPSAARAGYLEVTMLDPHPASNASKAQQYSVSNGPLGWVARAAINNFQSRTGDPAVVVPPNVNEAEVYYQHTPVAQAHGSNNGIYNLWGVVPVRGRASYFNLTAKGISHSGKFGVQDWYALNVAPTLGVGSPYYRSLTLTAAADAPLRSALYRPHARRPDAGPQLASYGGDAAPGASVRLYAARQGSLEGMVHVAYAKADAQGHWQTTTRPLFAGRYKLVAVSNEPGQPGPVKPTVWPDPLTVGTPRVASRRG